MKHMLRLYFGNTITSVTTLMLLSMIALIAYEIVCRATVHGWGRRTVFLAGYGLVICCFVAVRDGLDKTIQNAIDGSCQPGMFSLRSAPNIVGGIGAGVILLALIATPIAKSQHMREIWFYVMSAAMGMKILVLEISRILH